MVSGVPAKIINETIEYLGEDNQLIIESYKAFSKKQVNKEFASLDARKESYGTVALLEKQMDLARVIQEIKEVDVFIDAVQAQKAVLESAA